MLAQDFYRDPLIKFDERKNELLVYLRVNIAFAFRDPLKFYFILAPYPIQGRAPLASYKISPKYLTFLRNLARINFLRFSPGSRIKDFSRPEVLLTHVLSLQIQFSHQYSKRYWYLKQNLSRLRL